MKEAIIVRGVSSEAQYVDDATRRYRRYLHESTAFGIESVLRDALAEAWEECQDPNWDGFGALPVSREALRTMYTFLEALPLGFPRPTIGADPNGYLSVEWYRHSRRLLSIGIADDALLHYAALLGSSRTCGTETFFDDVPESILRLVRRVYE